MKNMVILEYMFMFNPSQTWSHLYEFEKSMLDFFNSKGLEATIVKTVEGSPGRRMLMITKKDVESLPTTPTPAGRPKGLKSYIKSVGEQKMKVPFKRVFKK